MIDLYFWPTPNGWKISIFLEEAALPYTIIAVDIRKGEQFKPEFLAISPNNRMPAIVDHAPKDSGTPISVFESGAILQYLAEKTGKFLPQETRARTKVLEWLNWQMGGVGPMFGQASHFINYAPDKIPYALERYTNESKRLLKVMDSQLGASPFIAGEYSIADMAIFPWVRAFKAITKKDGDLLIAFPNVTRWFDAVNARDAVQRGLKAGEEYKAPGPLDADAKSILFGINPSDKDRPESI